MQRSFPWPWILLAVGLLLLPGPVGRLLLDLLGGLTLLVVLLPLLAGGAALLGWTLLKRRLRACPTCGLASFGTEACPACGTRFEEASATETGFGGWPGAGPDAVDARDVTINVEAVEVGSGSEQDQAGPPPFNPSSS
ncbi:MAG: hypothetical protein VKO65_09170 [Cyanobacteriota bacterium]|nr:hypothetical protein [Cyanobacteriota bacterium]